MTDPTDATRPTCSRPDPPPLLPRVRRRPRLDRAGVAARATAGPTAPAATGRRTRWRPRPRPLPAAGEERHLPVHGRRAEPARAVRPQAQAPEAARPADPRVVHQGQAVRLHGHLHQGAAEAAGHDAQVRPARRVGRLGLRVPAAHSPSVVDDIAVVRSVATDVVQPRPGEAVREHRLDRSSAGRAWGRGSPTASAASRTTCPASSCCSPARAGRAAAPSLGQRVPADDLPGRAASARRRADPRTWPRPPGIDARPAAAGARRDPRPERASASTRPATPRSPRGSPPTRWPTGCRPAPRS